MAFDEMHNHGDVCKQLLEICTMASIDHLDGLKIDCLPCSCDLPIETVCGKYRLQTGTLVYNNNNDVFLRALPPRKSSGV